MTLNTQGSALQFLPEKARAAVLFAETLSKHWNACWAYYMLILFYPCEIKY